MQNSDADVSNLMLSLPSLLILIQDFMDCARIFHLIFLKKRIMYKNNEEKTNVKKHYN